MHHQKEILEKKKQQESDEITRRLEKKYEQELEKHFHFQCYLFHAFEDSQNSFYFHIQFPFFWPVRDIL
jgi:hypothetical protein